MENRLNGRGSYCNRSWKAKGYCRATAVALGSLGANVVVTGTGRDPETYPEDEKAVEWKDIESTARQIRQKGSKAKALVMDISKEDDVDNMVKQTLDEFGRIDILVNNAAPPYGEDRVPVVEVDNEVFKKVFMVKYMVRIYAPKLLQKL